MKFKKLVSALTLGTVFSTLALGTVSCLDTGAQEAIDNEFLENWNLSELESQKERIRFEADSGWIVPDGTLELPIIYEEGNITYDYTSSDRNIAVVVEKDGKPIIVAQKTEGEATITVRSSNNKIGYFKVTVSATREEARESEDTGYQSGLSSGDLANLAPTDIQINGKSGVKKLTIVEGEKITLRQTLSPGMSNGLWKINWYYNSLQGDEEYHGSAPGYFYYNVVDDLSKSQYEQNADGVSDGFGKNGLKMGYKVEVVGVAEGYGRYLHIECVNVKMDVEVVVIKKEQQETIPNIQVIGNKGNSVEMTGLSTSYITAAAYPVADNSMSFTATSLTPDICSVGEDNSFFSGEMCAIKAEKVGTGYVKVSMGRASQIVKVVINNEYIQCLGNIQFSVHAKKDVSGANNTLYPKQRVLADDEDSQAFGVYFPTTANAIYEGAKSVNFLAIAQTTGESGYAAVQNQGGKVDVYANGYFVTEKFKMERKFMKKSAKSYNALGGNVLYIGPDTDIKDTDDPTADDRLKAAKGNSTTNLSFAIHNKSSEETNTEWKSNIASGNKLGGGSTTTTSTDTSKSPIFFVVDTGKNDDIITVKAQAPESKYTNVSLEDGDDKGIYVKKTSLISQYKMGRLDSETGKIIAVDDETYSTFPDIIASETELPKTLYEPVPYKAPKAENGETISYSYTFAGWYEYDIATKTLGTTAVEKVSPNGKVRIIVAKFTEEEKKESALS